MPGELRFDHYEWRGGREAMVRFGPRDGPQVLALPALFDEANRSRALTVAIMRGLADRGIGSLLPDLPATGESLTPIEAVSLADWDMALSSVAAKPTHIVAIRGGTLLGDDPNQLSRWHFCPVDGASLYRDLKRTGAVARLEGSDLPDEAMPPIAEELATRRPVHHPNLRNVSFDGAIAPADLYVTGKAPWRLAEPYADQHLARQLADDIAAWVQRCEG